MFFVANGFSNTFVIILEPKRGNGEQITWGVQTNQLNRRPANLVVGQKRCLIWQVLHTFLSEHDADYTRLDIASFAALVQKVIYQSVSHMRRLHLAELKIITGSPFKPEAWQCWQVDHP